MGKHLAGRALRGILVLICSSLLSFLLCDLAPGDFFSDIRAIPGVTDERIEAMRVYYGVNQPVMAKYFHWLYSVVRGDWGISFAYGSPAAPILWSSAGNTLLLTVTAGLTAWSLALIFALGTAASNFAKFGTVIQGGFALLLGIPDILLVLAGTLFAAKTGLLPVGGMTSPDAADLPSFGKLWDLVTHMVIPVAVLTIASLPTLYTHASAAVCRSLAADYITVARAAGIEEGRVLFVYALRGAANPLISLLGFSVGTLLSSALIVEAVVGWPGIGRVLVNATLQRDTFLVIGAVMLAAILVFAGNLLSDVLLYASDPRIRRDGDQ